MGCFENRFSFESFEGKHYGRMAIKMTADDAGSTMRPSRLSSDGDLLNVILPPGSIRLCKRQTLSLGGRKYRLNNVETTKKPHAWRANIDDDYVDNCEQEKAMTLI
ncbi:unnamed protein product [Rhizophagus irregularis]|nr:unnamed protein product [Rhizophagus irregularis]